MTSPISAEAGERGREGSKEKNRTRLHLTKLVIGLRLVCRDMIRSLLFEPADFEDMLNRAELGVVVKMMALSRWVVAMVEEEIFGQGKFPLEKASGCSDRVWGDGREHQTPLLFSQVHFASGFESEFPAEVLGNQNLTLWRKMGYGHNFLLRFKIRLTNPEKVCKPDD